MLQEGKVLCSKSVNTGSRWKRSFLCRFTYLDRKKGYAPLVNNVTLRFQVGHSWQTWAYIYHLSLWHAAHARHVRLTTLSANVEGFSGYIHLRPHPHTTLNVQHTSNKTHISQNTHRTITRHAGLQCNKTDRLECGLSTLFISFERLFSFFSCLVFDFPQRRFAFSTTVQDIVKLIF